MKKGSTISLTCTVNVHSTPPSSVLWYHGHSVVDFDSPRGGISLETEKTEAGTTSKLLVTKALLSDTGNYTCMPSNASPASTVVHVLNGESPDYVSRSLIIGSVNLRPIHDYCPLLYVILNFVDYVASATNIDYNSYNSLTNTLTTSLMS